MFRIVRSLLWSVRGNSTTGEELIFDADWKYVLFSSTGRVIDHEPSVRVGVVQFTAATTWTAQNSNAPSELTGKQVREQLLCKTQYMTTLHNKSPKHPVREVI